MTRNEGKAEAGPAVADARSARSGIPGGRLWLWLGAILFLGSMAAGLARSIATQQALPRVGVEYTTDLYEMARREGNAAMLPHLRSAARIDFDNHLVVARLVEEARAVGDLDELVWALVALTRLKPEDSQVRMELADALLAQGRSAEALEHSRFAVWLSPNDPESHCSYGAALLRSGQHQQAVGAFQRALQLNPASEQARRGLTAAMQGL